jgi:hypothetical protein
MQTLTKSKSKIIRIKKGFRGTWLRKPKFKFNKKIIYENNNYIFKIKNQ